MMPEDRFKITSNDYMDLIIQYNGNLNILKQYEEYSVHIINPGYAGIYLPISQVTSRLVRDFGYSGIPRCFSLLSYESLTASGVTLLRNIPALNLRGKGVLVGFVDTGIDYTNPVFLKEDGTTKIAAIWDQTIDSGPYPELRYTAYYGTEYTAEQINEALNSQDPLAVVPSMDVNGHGTMLAGIAAGSENRSNQFMGVVPDAELLIVKLKQAKKNLTDYYFIPPDVACYQETDINWGVQYLINTADKLKRPLIVCLAVGTSQGPHSNSGLLGSLLRIVGDCPGVGITVAAGNEAQARRHFYSILRPAEKLTVELNVAPDEYGFTMELWGSPPMSYVMDILSPSGEYVPAISRGLFETKQVHFIFDQTILYIDYVMIERDSGKQVIMLRFKSPAPGIWRFKVSGGGDLPGDFHIWLPSGNFISNNTFFLNSNPYTTITSPGNDLIPITVVAYDAATGALYPESGKGFSTSNIINPDLAAPGVNVVGPTLNNEFTAITGTGAAAAHMAGIAAMIFEWGIVNNNYPSLDTVGIKKFLLRGAERNRNLQYPNQNWGYGIVDVYNSYNIFRTIL
ncbi:S8 family peptidase [Lacrimispora amygdalina]|uniref:S8 family peptidase n=1 Tax=Lacrimispora amygdalina TaxID=253257 RepID=UPI000BE484BE|nr:S8 family peptidase [Lacrimispora amygdalina]